MSLLVLVLVEQRLELHLEAVHAEGLDGLEVGAVVVLQQRRVVLLGQLGPDGAVQEVGDVDDGARHGQAREVDELGADRAAARLVVLEDDVAGVEAAVDEDAEAAVVRVVPQLNQLPEEV